MMRRIFFLLVLFIFSSEDVVASTQLVTKRLSELDQKAREAVAQNMQIVADKNAFRWWLPTNTPSTLETIKITTASGIEVLAGNTMLTKQQNCYVLLVDTSGSMKRHWQSTGIAVRQWLHTVGKDSSLYGFGEQLYAVTEIGQSLTVEEKISAFDRITLSGKNTQLYLAIRDALNKTENCESVRRHLVVFLMAMLRIKYILWRMELL